AVPERLADRREGGDGGVDGGDGDGVRVDPVAPGRLPDVDPAGGVDEVEAGAADGGRVEERERAPDAAGVLDERSELPGGGIRRAVGMEPGEVGHGEVAAVQTLATGEERCQRGPTGSVG